MSSFSLPFTYDKTYLVIPNPGTADNLNFQIKKPKQKNNGIVNRECELQSRCAVIITEKRKREQAKTQRNS